MFAKAAVAAFLAHRALLFVNAQDSSGFVPLASQTFTYTALPYQADPNNGERGTQSGYNQCNSTTETQTSKCQTAIINSIDDFCLWAPQDPNSLIGNVEGECVAWCTKAGHGTRQIPAGAITGLQFIRTADYVQVTGNINQALINIATDDSGGELDPHGADQRGNPLGALLFSNAFPASAGNPSNYIQAIEWHNFMGGGQFCLKACDPARPNAAQYCQHVFDRIGCKYNAPASYADNVFESCDGESQDFPGVYTGANGQVTTYQQPDEALGAITTMPYEPRIPATSQCTTFTSASLFAGAPSASGAATTGTNTRTSGGSSNTRTSSSTRTSSTASSTGAAAIGAKPAGALVGLLGGLAALVL
jgi:hypothetical protein